MQASYAGLPLDNKLLASLPRDHFDRLQPHLTTISLPQGDVLLEAGEEVDQIYFPHYGMLSLLAVLRDGKAIETATVGREGVVGAMAGLGLYKSLVRVVVQMPVAVSKIAASHFRTVAAGSDPVRNLCIRYNEVLLSQARVTAACNALHSIEARFCRWLLQSADRGGRRHRQPDAGISRRNAGGEADLGDRGRQQGAERRDHHLLPRRDQDCGPAGAAADVLRVLRNAAGPVGRAGLRA
jgi:CRP-like cAMP-binding protein